MVILSFSNANEHAAPHHVAVAGFCSAPFEGEETN
jgi:hypothetical protein